MTRTTIKIKLKNFFVVHDSRRTIPLFDLIVEHFLPFSPLLSISMSTHLSLIIPQTHSLPLTQHACLKLRLEHIVFLFKTHI